jgi:hypothetical protein
MRVMISIHAEDIALIPPNPRTYGAMGITILLKMAMRDL